MVYHSQKREVTVTDHMPKDAAVLSPYRAHYNRMLLRVLRVLFAVKAGRAVDMDLVERGACNQLAAPLRTSIIITEAKASLSKSRPRSTALLLAH